MSVFQDQRGVSYTAASQDAVDKFDATMTEYVHFSPETGARLKPDNAWTWQRYAEALDAAGDRAAAGEAAERARAVLAA